MKRTIRELPWLFTLLLMVGLLGACTTMVESGAVQASSVLAQANDIDDSDDDVNGEDENGEDDDSADNAEQEDNDQPEGEGDVSAGSVDCAMGQGEAVEIAEAKLYIEYNATDEDLGVHGAFDDHGWSELCVYDPAGAQILAVKPQGPLADLTMAGIFFESREPPTEEFGFEDLAASFAEGDYALRAVSYDGTGLTGAAVFTRNVPNPPEITAPPLAEDEEMAGDALVSAADLAIEWADVTETVSGDPLVISGYEVIVTKVEHDDPHGYSRPTFDVHVPADRNSLAVPIEFLESGTIYELEVLALEESGNQTITVGFFQTDESE